MGDAWTAKGLTLYSASYLTQIHTLPLLHALTLTMYIKFLWPFSKYTSLANKELADLLLYLV